MEKDIDIFVRGLVRYDPTVAERAQACSLEMMALLLVVGSAARIEIGPVEASVVAAETRSRIWSLLEGIAPEVSLLQASRLAEQCRNLL